MHPLRHSSVWIMALVSWNDTLLSIVLPKELSLRNGVKFQLNGIWGGMLSGMNCVSMREWKNSPARRWPWKLSSLSPYPGLSQLALEMD